MRFVPYGLLPGRRLLKYISKSDERLVYSRGIPHERSIFIDENTKKDIIECVKGKNTHDLRNICTKCGVNEEKTELLLTMYSELLENIAIAIKEYDNR